MEAPRANEFVSLHEINEWNVQRFFFDGIICHNGKQEYVERIPFDILSIGGYGELDSPAAEPEIWIQSVKGKWQDVWYRLRKPAAEYERFHKTFLCISTQKSVTLNDFRSAFYYWLMSTHKSDCHISVWLSHYEKQDFRHVVASQANFLWCQATQMDDLLGDHPLWGECHPRFLSALSENLEQDAQSDMFISLRDGKQTFSRRKTTVTPYVYSCFKRLPWAKFLFCQSPNIAQAAGWKKLSSSYNSHGHTCSGEELDIGDPDDLVHVGDAVALPTDPLTPWKSTDREWLGYVQSIKDTSKGRKLGLLWFYRPSDTQCLKTQYPHPEELFLSDHCNCGDSPFFCHEVIRKLRITYYGDRAMKGSNFFVRQKYVEADGAWTTLQTSDFVCACKRPKAESKYRTGKTVLVSISKVLEPAVFVAHDYSNTNKVKIRRLSRRRRDYGDDKAEPNELVITDHIHTIHTEDIARDCHIRFYTSRQRREGKIPIPYGRGGTGDFYFISAQDTDHLGLRPIQASQLSQLVEGWDPQAPAQSPLRGLDIFCGGGNFGRGLEEAGAVRFDWAVDWCKEAIHTYKANLKPENQPHLFYGSVNHYLTQVMQGIGADSVAKCDEVEVIAAGSPC